MLPEHKPAAYFDEYYVEALLNDVWVRLDDVLDGSVRGSWGILTNDPMERVGGIGRLEFSLRNDSGCQWGVAHAYTPYSPGAVPGWGIGTLVRAVWWAEGWHKSFAARVRPGGIKPDTNPWGTQAVRVTATDWMEDLAEADFPPIEYMTDLRADQVAEIIVARVPRAPLATDIQRGTRVFASAFDTYREGEGALGEMSKVIFSEQGYLYTRRDRLLGETLTLEAADNRLDREGPDNFPLSMAESDLLGDELGNYLTTASGHYIMLNQVQAGVLVGASTPETPELDYGKNIINTARAITYPRTISDDMRLWTLGNPIEIRPGQTLELRVRYTDPTGGGAQVSAQTASITTTIAANSQRDGGGSNIIGSVTWEADYGTSESIYYISTSVPGWLTQLELDGDAVLIYDALDTLWRNEVSIDNFGLRLVDIPMHYADEMAALTAAQVTIIAYSGAQLEHRAWQVLANGAAVNIIAWIFLDIGSRVTLGEPTTGAERVYYVQGIQFDTLPGGILRYTYTTLPARDVTYWELSVGALDLTTGLSPAPFGP